MKENADIRIRSAIPEDAPRLLEIYSYYVENTAVSFEYRTPSAEVFRERIEHTLEKYPYLVIEKAGRVMGYTYAGPFVGREAYGRSCELSIYIDKDARKCGFGRKLYEAIEDKLKNMGIVNLYACIGYPDREDEYLTADSAEFHARLGFRTAGKFHKCGYKFGRWYSMIWMEKIIGKHD